MTAELSLDNLAALGLEELDDTAATTIEGGLGPVALAIVCSLAANLIWDAANDVHGTIRAVKQGWHAI